MYTACMCLLHASADANVHAILSYNTLYIQPPKPANGTEFAKFELAAESRQIMSSTQMDWLTNNIKTSKQQWKVIGNQVNPAVYQCCGNSQLHTSHVFITRWHVCTVSCLYVRTYCCICYNKSTIYTQSRCCRPDTVHTVICMCTGYQQVMFTDMYKYTAGQKTPFSNGFIFPDMWIAYKKSQNILEDTMKSVKDVVVLTGTCVCLVCLHVYCVS
jgi:PhoD-like phosphatase